jgi:hypothetical protein
MITYEWKILELYAVEGQLTGIKYFVQAKDGENTVATQGSHDFLQGTVNLPLNQIKEENLLDWLAKDKTQPEGNLIKLNLEQQLNSLKKNNKIEPPWLAGTYTPQV